MRTRISGCYAAWLGLAWLGAAVIPLAAQAPGTITTLAGNGAGAFAGDGGPALLASLNNPVFVAFGSDGSFYIADDENHRVRRVAADGTISTVAGNGTTAYNGDGIPAVNAGLNHPIGLAFDRAGNLYIADSGNARIRKVDLNGTITTFAGNGVRGFSGDGGPATAAMLDCPVRLVFDAFENLLIADQCNHRIRKVDRNGIITTIAGSGTPGAAFGGFSGDGGPATAAQFKHPTAVTVDGGGNIYITDQINNRIRRVDRNGTVTTIAGSGASSGFSGDGGPATAAALPTPGVVQVDAAGNYYIADNINHRVRRVGTDGVITTIVGNGVASSTGDGGPASAATINNAFGIALDPSGNLFIAEADGNRIRKVFNVAPVVPTFSSAGITNGASFLSGGTPGGAIATIFGVNLSNVNGIVQAQSTPLPTELGGTSVRIGGVLAPLFAVVRANGSEQINLQVPFSIAQAALSARPAQAQQVVEVVITNNGVSNAPVLMQLAAAQPGIFLVDGVNGAILHADNRLVSAQNPAARGETVVVFATGLGPVQDPPAAGEPASLTKLSPTTPAFASATLGGSPAAVIFSGLAPGFVGLYQVNLIVPQSSATGSLDLAVTMNGAASNTAKIAVQ